MVMQYKRRKGQVRLAGVLLRLAGPVGEGGQNKTLIQFKVAAPEMLRTDAGNGFPR